MISNNKIKINSNYTYELKTIQPSDVTEKYMLSLENFYIETAKNIKYLEELRNNVKEKNLSDDYYLFGLYFKKNLIASTGITLNLNKRNVWNDLIIKIDNEDLASIGILIHDDNFKNLGLSKILIWSACILCNSETSQSNFCAGMKKENIKSIKSFLSIGFEIFREYEENVQLYLNLKNIIQPKEINNFEIIKFI